MGWKMFIMSGSVSLRRWQGNPSRSERPGRGARGPRLADPGPRGTSSGYTNGMGSGRASGCWKILLSLCNQIVHNKVISMFIGLIG